MVSVRALAHFLQADIFWLLKTFIKSLEIAISILSLKNKQFVYNVGTPNLKNSITGLTPFSNKNNIICKAKLDLIFFLNKEKYAELCAEICFPASELLVGGAIFLG